MTKAGLAALILVCAVPTPRRAASGPPSILLITLDTTRADAMGVEAGARAGTPAFTALASQGIRFTRAYATAPETLPSHTSMYCRIPRSFLR